MIQFTPLQLWAGILAIAGAIVTLSGAVTAVAKLVAHTKKPNVEQNKRIDAHERWLIDHDQKILKINDALDRDKQRLDAHDAGNKVTQQALLALLSHALDGNDTASLKAAKEALEKYLIHR